MCQVVKKAGVAAGRNPIGWSAGSSTIRWSHDYSLQTTGLPSGRSRTAWGRATRFARLLLNLGAQGVVFVEEVVQRLAQGALW